MYLVLCGSTRRVISFIKKKIFIYLTFFSVSFISLNFLFHFIHTVRRCCCYYRARAEVIDFSVPYFHSGVSLLAAPQSKSDIPLLAFLLPFSPELWIAIFTSLNITAIAVAVYEWLSPFGLNPWGRQRSKNFSMSSGRWISDGACVGGISRQIHSKHFIIFQLFG